MKLILQRMYMGEDCTLGTLSLADVIVCYVLELPWKSNERNISCIPAGEYTIMTGDKKGLDHKWIFHNVTKRAGIQIHAGNTVKDTTGCILPGVAVADFNGEKGVSDSRLALERLNSFLTCFEEIQLEVRDI